MQRIYLSEKPAASFCSDDTELHHQFSRVLRARVGDKVLFFGADWASEYCITEITKRTISFDLVSEHQVTPEGVEITLFQAIPNKLEKVEYIIQKWVEVGISHFVFFQAERSQSLPLLEKKLDRLNLIAKEALEQSGGFVLPRLEVLSKLESSRFWTLDTIILLHTAKHQNMLSLPDLAPKLSGKIGILVGPEGGFSDIEAEKFVSLGAQYIYLGERILRTETAGVVVGFMVRQLLGEKR